jgi:hypothetical protein
MATSTITKPQSVSMGKFTFTKPQSVPLHGKGSLQPLKISASGLDKTKITGKIHVPWRTGKVSH